MVAHLPLRRKGKTANTSLTKEEGPHSALTPDLPLEASGGLAPGLPHLVPIPHLGQREGALAPLPAGIAPVEGVAVAVVALHVGAGASASLVSEGRGSGRGRAVGEGQVGIAKWRYIYLCMSTLVTR